MGYEALGRIGDEPQHEHVPFVTLITLWTIHNGVFDAPTVYILTWPRFTVKVLTIYCIQRQYLSF